MSRRDGESNENVNGRFGMSSKGEGMSCGVVGKCSTLRWFGHLERMGESEMTRIYKSGVDAGNVRRQSTVKWECWSACVRGLEDVRMTGENADSCRGHPLEEVPRDRC